MRQDLEELVILDDLLKKGILTEEEFSAEKDKILNRRVAYQNETILNKAN